MKRTNEFYLNLIHSAFEYKAQILEPKSIPIDLYLEPSTLCNLKCPSCPTGLGLQEIRERTTIEVIEMYARELGPYLLKWHLFNWGEPSIHPDFSRILEILNQYPFSLHLSTNFSIPLSEQDITQLANGLRSQKLQLKIDMDGFTGDIQNMYRQGSKVDIVKENCRKLSAHLSAQGQSYLRPWLSFLKFEHNSHQEHDVRNFAETLGFAFKSYEPLKPNQSPEPVSIPDALTSFGCGWLYGALTITPSGNNLQPCCGGWSRSNSIETPSSNEPSEILNLWSSDQRMQKRRQLSAHRTQIGPYALNAVMNFNRQQAVAMDVKQRDSSSDICERCNLGISYYQHTSLLIDGAIHAIKHLFGSSANTNMYESLLKASHSSTMEGYSNLLQAIEATNHHIKFLLPSQRAVENYEPIINLFS